MENDLGAKNIVVMLSQQEDARTYNQMLAAEIPREVRDRVRVVVVGHRDAAVSDDLFIREMSRLLPDVDDWDLPLKRNYALLESRRNGFRAILLVDDDIRGLAPGCVEAAARALKDFPIVGWYPTNAPDTSTVGHACLLAGLPVSVFLSGSCLLVDVDAISHGFLPVYNEDWLFMYPFLLHGRVACAGSVRQVWRDPFQNPNRARFEEFGEVLAEGLLGSLHNGDQDGSVSLRAWERLIGERRAEITSIRSALETHIAADAHRALTCIAAAESALEAVSPQHLKAVSDAFRAFAHLSHR